MKITNMETFDKMTKTVFKTGLTIIVVKTMTDVDYTLKTVMNTTRRVNMRTNRVLKAKKMKAMMNMNNMKIVKTMTMADVENNKDNYDGDEQL